MSSDEGISVSDLTGKNIFIKNVAISWSLHVLVVIAGFILPRMIDHTLGPALLGVWDLGWASVQYMTLTGFGIGAALNRYVGMSRAAGDTASLSKTTTAAFVWQIFITILVIIITLAVSLSLPLWAEIDSTEMVEAQYVLFLLGLSLAVKMLFDHTSGVLTGFHLWWVQNTLNTVQDVLIAISIVIILLLGGNLIHMAVAVLITSVIFSISRIALVKILCPEVRIDLKLWDKKDALDLLKFGVKNLVGMTPQVLVFQTAAILLMGYVSPTALALFNRGVALVRHVEILIRKVATMLVPMTSSLIGMNRNDEANNLLLQGTVISMCLAIPGVIVLFIFGDMILGLWMGEDYSDKSLMMIISSGALLPIGTSGTYSVLAGFNAHGKAAFYSLVVTFVTIIIGIYLASLFGWTITSVAAVCAASWTLGRFLPLPYYLKLYFNVNLLEYLFYGLLKPIAVNVPFLLVLYLVRQQVMAGEYMYSVGLFMSAIIINASLYWSYLLTNDTKKSIIRMVK